MTATSSIAVSSEAELLRRFVSAFKRGIEGEVAALRASSDTIELVLGRGEDLGSLRYGFELPDAPDKLAAGGEYVLRTSRGDARVAIERCDDLRITVVSDHPIDLTAQPIALVVAPWFLYDRLSEALASLDIGNHFVALALTLFGKRPHRRAATVLRRDHGALNASQRAAVQLCSDSELAFIWGPPGTGKTATLTHVIDELLAQNRRILLASTTNAAIDQVLAKLAVCPWFAAAVEAGAIVRLGRSDSDTFGTEVADAVGRTQGKHRDVLDRARRRIVEVEQQIRHAESLLSELAPAASPQRSLFGDLATGLRPGTLASVFPTGLAETVARMPAPDQQAIIALRLTRLTRLRGLVKERVAHHAAALRDVEARVISNARVVMCTLANAYLAPAMKAQRFDVLIAEEAGMAALPALFYAACLCRDRAIMVGDPRQLPPIVHSRDELVQRTIARSVFEVTIPDPTRSDVVAMLDVQYRMHPVIGALVGQRFYGGRLSHGVDVRRTDAIAARAPYRGMPLTVLDTDSLTTCRRSAKGASRVNAASAELTAGLAFEAVTDGAESVAVITPYAAQAHDIRRHLAARRIADAVECSTIHRFQGRECDVVIIDLVDAAPMRPGVLLSGTGSQSDACHLLNVSVSRARGKLVLVADVPYFEAHAPVGVITDLLRDASERGIRIRLARAAPG